MLKLQMLLTVSSIYQQINSVLLYGTPLHNLSCSLQVMFPLLVFINLWLWAAIWQLLTMGKMPQLLG